MLDYAERQLWCAVIDRALQDAMDQAGGVAGPLARRRASEDARRWFIQNGADFRQACESAGCDPDQVRGHVLPMIAARLERSA
jgi:hypothetical protein